MSYKSHRAVVTSVCSTSVGWREKGSTSGNGVVAVDEDSVSLGAMKQADPSSTEVPVFVGVSITAVILIGTILTYRPTSDVTCAVWLTAVVSLYFMYVGVVITTRSRLVVFEAIDECMPRPPCYL
jgi:hypothetical protein